MVECEITFCNKTYETSTELHTPTFSSDEQSTESQTLTLVQEIDGRRSDNEISMALKVNENQHGSPEESELLGTRGIPEGKAELEVDELNDNCTQYAENTEMTSSEDAGKKTDNSIFNVDLSNLPYPPGYSVLKRHEPKHDSNKEAHEGDLSIKGPSVSPWRLLNLFPGFSKIENLTEYTGLKCLFLEVNGIQSISGLESQTELRSLYLSKNLIRRIENLDHLQYLDTLDISNNMISRIENLDKLPNFTRLIIAHNKLSDLEDLIHLVNCPQLSVLDLQHNHIKDPEVIEEVFAKMPSLRVLYNQGNPFVREVKNYRRRIINLCKQLTYLDDRPVFPKDRACAEAFFEGGAEYEYEVRQKWNEAEQQKIIDSCRWLREKRQIIEARRHEKELKDAAEAAGLSTDDIHVNPGDIDWLYGDQRPSSESTSNEVLGSERLEGEGQENEISSGTVKLSEDRGQETQEKATSGAGDVNGDYRTRPRSGPAMAAQMIQEMYDDFEQFHNKTAEGEKSDIEKQKAEHVAYGQIVEEEVLPETLNLLTCPQQLDENEPVAETDEQQTLSASSNTIQTNVSLDRTSDTTCMDDMDVLRPRVENYELEVSEYVKPTNKPEVSSVFGNNFVKLDDLRRQPFLSQLVLMNNSNEGDKRDDDEDSTSVLSINEQVTPEITVFNEKSTRQTKACNWTNENSKKREFVTANQPRNALIIEVDDDVSSPVSCLDSTEEPTARLSPVQPESISCASLSRTESNSQIRTPNRELFMLNSKRPMIVDTPTDSQVEECINLSEGKITAKRTSGFPKKAFVAELNKLIEPIGEHQEIVEKLPEMSNHTEQNTIEIEYKEQTESGDYDLLRTDPNLRQIDQELMKKTMHTASTAGEPDPSGQYQMNHTTDGLISNLSALSSDYSENKVISGEGNFD
ncbi:hypothetical protein P879_06232 [Paragonimus westermani]|uniref:Dynein assembly factor 1, axonemal homolog n=1 Tax=Paragonimus westermani TaxID=34504 RepID=A0A8T0DL96_9TREM|nr:hypothetical protein P879_06232 [Paragonimus westermani]